MDEGHRGARAVRVTAARARGAVGLAVLLAGLTASCRQSSVEPDVARATTTTVRELSPAYGVLALPVRDGSIRFAVIGDSGRGDAAQHEIARQMVEWRKKCSFDFVLMLGDN